ncbi:hypothetical protein TSOC_012701 [Tetrabaena socialis]|uniref:Uncharacterized protein n=1 Tax=Tetrabaena socialis TaxID=47790 RepID=A0A2J7ZMC2_9CHLO|nr:hypothetical protein TSOC_012701 [Tetrabaena socialis]|eukprot:PNH01417.1 hypothetical protein TSOC_012701 [Tetrabaena socialis]
MVLVPRARAGDVAAGTSAPIASFVPEARKCRRAWRFAGRLPRTPLATVPLDVAAGAG